MMIRAIDALTLAAFWLGLAGPLAACASLAGLTSAACIAFGGIASAVVLTGCAVYAARH